MLQRSLVRDEQMMDDGMRGENTAREEEDRITGEEDRSRIEKGLNKKCATGKASG